MILAMIVLGGMGNIWGVVLGAVILTFAPEFLRAVVEPFQMSVFNKVIIPTENARMLVFGLALVAMMLLRPEGLLPSRRRKAELSHAVASEGKMAGGTR